MSNSKMFTRHEAAYRNHMLCDCSVRQLQQEQMSQVAMEQYGMGPLKKKVSVSGTLRNNMQNSLKKQVQGQRFDSNQRKVKDGQDGSSQKKVGPRIQQFSAQQNHPLYSNQPLKPTDKEQPWRQKNLSPSSTLLHVMRLPRHEIIKRPQIQQIVSPSSHVVYIDRASPIYRQIPKKPQPMSGKTSGSARSDKKPTSQVLEVPANKISQISKQMTSAETDTHLWRSGTESEIQSNVARNGIELREVHSIYGESQIHERSVEQSLDESLEIVSKIEFGGLLPDFSKIRIARSTYRKEKELPEHSIHKQGQAEV